MKGVWKSQKKYHLTKLKLQPNSVTRHVRIGQDWCQNWKIKVRQFEQFLNNVPTYNYSSEMNDLAFFWLPPLDFSSKRPKSLSKENRLVVKGDYLVFGERLIRTQKALLPKSLLWWSMTRLHATIFCYANHQEWLRSRECVFGLECIINHDLFTRGCAWQKGCPSWT